MGIHEESALNAFLFSDERQLLDLKCFRGDRANVSKEEISSQLHSAFMQKEMGRAKISTDAPKVTASVINVKEFVSKI